MLPFHPVDLLHFSTPDIPQNNKIPLRLRSGSTEMAADRVCFAPDKEIGSLLANPVDPAEGPS